MSVNDDRLAADIALSRRAGQQLTQKSIIEDLRLQLENRDRAMEALAAESAALKSASDRQREFILNGVEFGYIRLPDQPDPAIATHAQCLEGIKTPATDAFINSVRAEGVEIAASDLFETTAIGHGMLMAFAAQLRAGKDGD